MADLKFTADYSDLSKTVDVLIKLGNASDNTARAFAQAGRQIVSWQDKFAVEQGKANAAIEAQYQKQKLANKSAKESASAFEAQAKAIERLSSKYKPLYASSQLYSKELDSINQAHKLGVLNAQQHEAAVEQLNQEYTNGVGRFSTWAQGAVKGFNKTGVAVQQAGYQFSDFIVQVQSGQSPFVAFSQQATQLVGIMYLLPPATLAARVGLAGVSVSLATATAGLSIIIPLLASAAMAFTRSGKGAKESADALDRLKTATANLKSSNEILKTDLIDLRAEFGQYAEAILNVNRELVDFRAAAVLQELSNQAAIASEAMDEFSRLVGFFGQVNYKYLEQLGREYGVTATEMERFVRTAKQFSDAATLDEQLVVLDQLRNLWDEIGINLSDLPPDLLAAVTRMKELQEESLKAASAVETIAGTDMASGIASAGDEARRLAGFLEASALRVAQLRSGGTYKEVGSFWDNPQNDATFSATGRAPTTSIRPMSAPFEVSLGDPNKTGGGGGAPKETAADFIKALKDEADYRRRIIGMSEEEARIEEILYDGKKKGFELDREVIAGIAEYEASTRKLIEAQEQAQRQQETFKDILMDGMESLITGSKSVEDAFKDMLRNILLDIYRQKIMEPLANAGSNFLMKFLGMANGGAFNKGVQMFANGGVVGSPTMFGHSGGLGVMGEAGPEAIMPLKRGKNGKLGVQMDGSAGNISVTNNINVTGNSDPAAVRMEIAKLMPQIEKATINSVINARKRGGQMKAAFI